MKYLLILILSITLNANITQDFKHFLAQKAYKNQEYKKALKLYKGLPQSSDIKFEIAQSLYRLKRYKEAIVYFKSIDKPELNGAISYNIANCYYMLKDYKNAKKFYKNAKKFKDTKELATIGLKKLKAKVTSFAKIRVKHCKGAVLGLGDLNAKIYEFSDPFVSQNLKLAKLKDEEKSNTLNNAKLENRDEIVEFLEANSSKKSDKLYNLNSLKEQRVEKRLKNINSKTLLIPIKEQK